MFALLPRAPRLPRTGRLPRGARLATAAAVLALSATGCLGTGTKLSQDNSFSTHTSPGAQPAVTLPSRVPSVGGPQITLPTIPPPNPTLSPAP